MSWSPRESLRRRAGAIGLLVIALLAMGGALRNGWVQDDAPLIAENPAVQRASGLYTGFVEPYWPPPVESGLYRPLARTLHTIQWALGGGGRWPFRLTTLALYGALVLAVGALARELVDPRAAWAAAAVFAAHPVHVEAVAVAVNQGELAVALLGVVIARYWVRQARAGSGPRPSGALLLAAGLAAGLAFKEHAAMLPLLLVGLEVTILACRPEGRRTRLVVIVLLAIVAGGWWWARTVVLGDYAGAAPVEGLRGAGLPARALTMLGVAGEWARLLLWPARLQADYSPWEIAPYDRWRAEQTAGLLVVVAFAGALALTWRRRPAAAFALAWVAIALAPISNLVIPTGILLAERTLLLASVGVVLFVAALIPAEAWTRPALRVPLLSAVVTIIGLGIAQSSARMAVWRDSERFIAALVRDAPDSWRTQVSIGIAEMNAGRRIEGEARLRRAHAMWPDSPRPLQLLAFYYRLDGLCAPALPLLAQALRQRPQDGYTRVPYVACLLDQGYYPAAARIARAGSQADPHSEILALAAAVADSAHRHGIPPQSVRLPPVAGGLTLIGAPRAIRGGQ